MLIENPLSTSPSAYPVLECFHIAGFALAIGMTALVDFRLLGFGLLGQSAAQIMRAFQWWTLGGLVIGVFSGLLIFSTDPDMYYLNWSFLVKMAFLVTAIIFNYTIHRQSVSGRYSNHAARLIAVVSLLLWTSVIFGGIFIAVAPNGPG
jgi:Family of unknown function (DUF6644)